MLSVDKSLLLYSLKRINSTSERPAETFSGRRAAVVMADQKIVDNRTTSSNDDDGETDEDDTNDTRA